MHEEISGRWFGREVLGALVLKGSALGLAFLTRVYLARVLGPAGYGSYSFAMAWVGLLAVPAVLGMDRTLIRFCAQYQTQREWGKLRGLLREAIVTLLITSFALGGITAGLSPLLPHWSTEMTAATLVALALVPVTALLRGVESAMQGLHRGAIGRLGDMFVRPALFLVLVAVLCPFLDLTPTAVWAVAFHGLALLAALVTGGAFLVRALPPAVRSTKSARDAGTWRQATFVMFLVAVLHGVLARTDAVLLGFFRGPEEVAVYSVARGVAELTTVTLIAVNIPLSGVISHLFTSGEHRRLQDVVARTTLFAASGSAVLGSVLLVGARPILAVFGPAFVAGSTSLAVLCGACMINVGAGSASLLLTMTGRERVAAAGLGMGAGLNLVLDVALIPRWGHEGAALATATSMIAWNVLLAGAVHRLLGIDSTVFGLLRRHVQERATRP